MLVTNILLAQSSIRDEESDNQVSEQTKAQVKGFRGIEIGMSIDEVKSALLNDSYFNYHGDPDVYFLPKKEQSLIECSGNSYIKRAFFQFYDKKLFIMIIVLDPLKIDYYTLFTALKEKYGNFLLFSPEFVKWEGNDIRLSLEKPLWVKYVDIDVFEKLKQEGKAQEKAEGITLDEFIKDF